MKTIRLLLAMCLVWATSSCAGAQDLSRYDLSTDKGVNAARASITGKEIDQESRGCIRRSESLPGIVLVGDFAYDRGCALEGAFVGKKYFKMDADLSKAVLDYQGWAKANGAKREALALSWAQFGLLAFEYPLMSPTEHFSKQKFEVPHSETNAQGEVVVSLWNQEPSGMLCQTAYQRLGFTFSKDGSLKETKTLQSLIIPCKTQRTQ